MRQSMYLQMLTLIDMYHTWVVVDDGYGYGQCVVFRRGRLRLCACRILRLRSLYRHDGYKGGTVWRIPEYELDNALAAYRKTNPGAGQR
ncbi:MAG: hypothetical protein LUC18_02995, partial [Porphyromonadaceae bacterium]|nr:hypothetical protein [Porphyromonadaceae bacterium]